MSAVRFELIANTDLQASDGAPNSWSVRGGKPGFELRGPIDLDPGWAVVVVDVSVEDALADERGTASPMTLRFLPESGNVALSRRPVPLLRGTRTRVVHIPEGTARIELDVSPWVSTVVGGTVSFRPVRPTVAAAMMSSDVLASATVGSTDRSELTGRLRGARTGGGFREVLAEVAIAYEHLQHRRSGDSVDYPSWRARNGTAYDDDLDRLRERCARLPGGGPSISVVIPVYNPKPSQLREAVESVRAQVHERWQLILVDDASTNADVAEALREIEGLDDRIIVRRRQVNGHIAQATNDGLALATGEFVAFMDHDDLLAPFALAIVALSAKAADIIYTDEDKVDDNGRHFDPHLKPGWNPELLLGQNYLSHLTVVRRSLLRQVGYLREGFDGAQDHDLMLRATAVTAPNRIVHLPFVAYHWRATEGSTALAPTEKNYTEEASIAALRDRLGDDWGVSLAGPTAYRCSPPLSDFPLVSIIIPTRDRLELLEQCVESLRRTTYPAFEILVVDNDSSEAATLEWMSSFDNGHDHRVISAPGKFNFSAINNTGVTDARGELVLLLNNDTEVIEPDWLTHMVRWALQDDVGIVGAKLLYPEGTIQHAGVVLGLGGLAGHGHLREPADATGYFNRLVLTHEVGAVTGACLLTWRHLWDSVGGLDESLAVAFNDIDYCLRVRHELGRRVLWCPDAVLTHHESVSRGAEDDPVKVARFNAEVDLALERWADVLHDDPAYSPNLTLSRNSFTLAREPRVEPPWAPSS